MSSSKQLRDKINEIKNSYMSDEDKQILISAYTTKYKNINQPQYNLFEQFEDLNIVTNSVNKSFSNSDIVSNVNSNKIKHNNAYSSSSSSSSSSSLNSDGTTTVCKNKTENKNGKIKTENDCYKIDKYGNKTNIEEHFFGPTNNYGRSIK